MAVSVVNQWQGVFSQPSAFGTTPPALESVVVALTPANSVGGGTGTPSAGNWLVCITGMNEPATTAGFTVGVGDDIHSYWRPGKVSTGTALTRTSLWYTPNAALAAGNVYVAPNGSFDALAVLILEISGAGPWDTLTGTASNYAAAATTLNLALGAPGVSSFAIAAVCGDDSTHGQAFAPGGWTALHTVTATNGTDHTSDSVLTSAILPSNSGSLSVNGTASSATDLSGVIVSFQISAPSPVPAGGNPNWPFLKFEAAFGGGFQTPQDQLAWTDLSNRLWSWDETTGAQYQLGNIQATDLEMELDNFDNALASDNTGSPYYSNALNSNMSFEAGVSPWNLTDPSAAASAVQSSAQAFSGTSSMLVTPTAGGHSVVLSEQVPAAAGSVYSASAWFFSPAGWAAGGQVQVNWYNSGHTYLSTSNNAAIALPAATWTQRTLTNVTAPASTAFAQVVVNLSGSPTGANTFYVDEAAIVAGSSVVSTHLVTTGTPLRIRAALGVIGGVTVNRWYVISRNLQEWPQQVAPAFRRYVAGTGTDIWSALSASGPTPYRGEIIQDSPYAWWPMDDQPLAGGVQPTSLRNAALGNTNVLNITASGAGIGATDTYSTSGTDLTNLQIGSNLTSGDAPPSVATSAVGQQAGWQYGDPQSSPASYQTSNPVTSAPGSGAWQQTGLLGNTGTQTWCLTCNDASFPALAGGITVKGWFLAGFEGSSGGAFDTSLTSYVVAAQPVAPITLCTLGTSTAPVFELQMDTSGHLNAITFAGTTPTSHSVYSSSDLRNGSWTAVDITLTATTWAVFVNGGITASASGSVSAMTSAWTWLTLNADYGNTHGGSSPASIVHGGDLALSHWAVFGAILPAWRIRAHYCAAVTAFGLLPAPAALALTPAQSANTAPANTPDGTENQGSYGLSAGSPTSYTFSCVAVAKAGTFTSGPSARATIAGIGTTSGSGNYGAAVFAGFSVVAPSALIYTAAAANAETNASTVCGSGDSYTTGFGSGASGHGVCHTAGGSGASPPASASALGDTVAQRLERILAYGQVTYPGRCIDPASLPVQAATDIGGQQAGQNLSNIAQSDGGLLAIDNLGNLTYWQKSHLAAQFSSPAWTLTPVAPPAAGAPATAIPYYRDFRWIPDPHRVWNSITVQPFSPDGTSLADITPSNATAADASQMQYGAQPLPITSYLQSITEMQSQADWLLSNFGQVQIRADNVKIDAAPYPAAWPLVLGINVGDVVSMQNWQIGGGGTTMTFRVSGIKRVIRFGDDRELTEASATLQLDWEPSSYWS